MRRRKPDLRCVALVRIPAAAEARHLGLEPLPAVHGWEIPLVAYDGGGGRSPPPITSRTTGAL